MNSTDRQSTNEDQKRRFFTAMAALPGTSIEPGYANAALQTLGPLPGFLKALLVADGTVTMALEAFFGETIRIAASCQEQVTLPFDVPALDMFQGDICFFRQVELLGEKTGRCYAAATSMLNPRAIGKRLFEELVDEHVGIGVILRNSARGSFREVLQLQTGGLMSQFDVHRTYRVSLNGAAAILITEEFPLEVFQT